MFMVYGKDIRHTTLESIEAEFAMEASAKERSS
jgi:hypothetical protein